MHKAYEALPRIFRDLIVEQTNGKRLKLSDNIKLTCHFKVFKLYRVRKSDLIVSQAEHCLSYTCFCDERGTLAIYSRSRQDLR